MYAVPFLPSHRRKAASAASVSLAPRAPLASVSKMCRALEVPMRSRTRTERRFRRASDDRARCDSANNPSMRRRTSSDGLPCNASRKVFLASSPKSRRRS